MIRVTILIGFFADVQTIGINCSAFLNLKSFPGLTDGISVGEDFFDGN